jgi:hypothetical protein
MIDKAILQFTEEFCQEHQRFPIRKEYPKEYRNNIQAGNPTLKEVRDAVIKKNPSYVQFSSDIDTRRKLMLDWGGEFLLKEFGRMPTYGEFKNRFPKQFNSVRHIFVPFRNYEDKLRELFPSYFRYQSLKEAYEANKQKSNKCKRFILTTAVTGCDAFIPALDSLRYYCKLKNAEIIILPSSDPAKKNKNLNAFELDKRIIEGNIIAFDDVFLNNNIMISKIKLSAKQIDGTTGLARLSKRTGTFIFSSPKQRLKSIPVSNQKNSRLLATTGAITLPDYDTDRYMSERTAELAKYDHVMGALIVEIVDDEKFHIRQIQFDDQGRFIDLGIEYGQKTHKPIKTLSLWPGDWHVKETCPNVRRQIIELCGVLKPQYLFFNDFFSGISVNPHEASDKIVKSQLHMLGDMSLKDELDACADELAASLNWGAEKIIVVKSNHDDFLENWYLRKANFIDRDGMDYRLGLELSIALLDGHNPIEFYARNYRGVKSSRIRFLKIDEDLILAGIQHGAHGHLGSGGKRNPNAQGLELAYGKGNFGHCHYAEILRDVYRAGTSTPTRLPYVKGSCNWNNSHIITYYNGSRQIIFTFDDYRLRD